MTRPIALTILGLFSTALQAANIEYLEEKTAYCHSKQSLVRYLNMAKMRNIDGMNQLVLDGKCDFVPDGQVISLTNYRKHSIGSMPVVVFEQDDQTLWTFQALVQETNMDNL